MLNNKEILKIIRKKAFYIYIYIFLFFYLRDFGKAGQFYQQYWNRVKKKISDGPEKL